MTKREQVKVAVTGENGDIETMWATPLHGDLFRLDNLPFQAFGISLGDTVCATNTGGRLTMRDVVARSGHSTYRLALQDGVDPEQFVSLCRPLVDLGCGLERFTRPLIGVDIPPAVDLRRAYDLISGGMERGIWWFDEVHVGHPVT